MVAMANEAGVPNDELQARFDRAVAPYELHPGVAPGTGFGGASGRRVGGRIFAMLVRGALVVKLPAARVAELTASGDGVPFDAGNGRPMREWVSVPASDPDPWPPLVAEAFAFVSGDRGG
jgi:hypothetical protein